MPAQESRPPAGAAVPDVPVSCAVPGAAVSGAALDAAEATAAAFQAGGGQPGMAWGIVAGGLLVRSGGFGERCAGGETPDADTVFRIASVSKSFTASAVLALRDDGALSLDDLAEKYVPALRGWPPVTPDSGRVRIRHLLTMTAGFPTDDPWGDRQQGLPLDDFGRLLEGGVSFAWAPGTRFEYSNLGYAILGLIITAVTGVPYPAYVRARLLEPLGLASTGYEEQEFSPAVLARGYRGSGGGWEQVALDPCGAFAPMGGVFSTVRDLSRWVAGFAAAFPPGGQDTMPARGPVGVQRAQAGRHPLALASRREMQLPQVLIEPGRLVTLPGGDAAGRVMGYGFGLLIHGHPSWDRIVGHSGGYPGFGANMCWHPATGIGVIALANSTYAGMVPLTMRMLGILLTHRPPRNHRVSIAPAQPVPVQSVSAQLAAAQPAAAGGPWPQTLAARAAVNRLLRSWDDAEAAALFSPNVDQDRPLADRRRVIGLIRERIGCFRDDPARPPEHDTPAHCRWWLASDEGVTEVQIRLTPERPPRVQSLILAIPPAQGSVLRGVLDRLVAWMNGGSRDWPDSIDASLDTSLLSRRLRMAAAWSGDLRLGAWRAGDGTAAGTVELDGEHASLVLYLLVDPAAGTLRAADIHVLP